MIKSEITDKFGNKIVITEERWSHIVIRHPDMAKNYKFVEKAITNPTVVARNTFDRNINFYHKYFKELNRFVVVIINITKKFVITAYLAESVKQGEVVWKAK